MEVQLFVIVLPAPLKLESITVSALASQSFRPAMPDLAVVVPPPPPVGGGGVVVVPHATPGLAPRQIELERGPSTPSRLYADTWKVTSTPSLTLTEEA